MAKFVVATFSTWVTPTIMIEKGQMWDAEDPVVTSHPDWFTADPSEHAHTSSGDTVAEKNKSARKTVRPVEAATANPGEKRNS